jgi:preprotein translocase subunit SecD
MKKVILVMVVTWGALVFAMLLLVGVSRYLRQTQSALLAHPPEHGVSFVFGIDPGKLKEDPSLVSHMKETMQKRAYQLGMRICWEPVSETQFKVSAEVNPGDVPRFSKALSSRGLVEFRLVHPESDDLIKQELIPPGYTVLQHPVHVSDGQTQTEKLLVKRKPEAGLTEAIVKRAWVDRNALGELEIRFELKPAAAQAFANLTKDNIGQRLAILMDGQLYSVPMIRSPIENGNGVITGRFKPQDAEALASVLEYTLPVAIKVLETKRY